MCWIWLCSYMRKYCRNNNNINFRGEISAYHDWYYYYMANDDFRSYYNNYDDYDYGYDDDRSFVDYDYIDVDYDNYNYLGDFRIHPYRKIDMNSFYSKEKKRDIKIDSIINPADYKTRLIDFIK